MIKVERVCRKQLNSHYLDSVIDILPYLLHHITLRLSSSLSTHLIFDAFQNKSTCQYTSCQYLRIWTFNLLRPFYTGILPHWLARFPFKGTGARVLCAAGVLESAPVVVTLSGLVAEEVCGVRVESGALQRESPQSCREAEGRVLLRCLGCLLLSQGCLPLSSLRPRWGCCRQGHWSVSRFSGAAFGLTRVS